MVLQNIKLFLLLLWLASLPFYHFSVIGSFSVDNVLVLALFVIAFTQVAFQRKRLGNRQFNNIFSCIIIAILYFIFHTIKLIAEGSVAWSSMYSVATSMLYFLVPVLSITGIKELRLTNNLLVFMGLVASATALPAAMGLIEFEFSRAAESRLGYENLQKAIGVISAYGDVGIIFSVSLLLAIAKKKEKFLFGVGSNLKIFLVLTIVLVGVASMQSRNMVLTILISMGIYWLVGWLVERRRFSSKKMYGLLAIGGVSVVFILVLFGTGLLEAVSSIGGTKEAKGTVMDRLAQYQYALELVEGRWLLGVDSHFLAKNSLAVSLIHNMWLKEFVQGGLFALSILFVFVLKGISVQSKNILAGVMMNDAKAYLAVIFGLLVATQFYPGGTLIFWAIVGIVCSMPVVPARGR